MNVGWGVPGELKDSHEESPVFPQPAALGKETEEVFMGLPAVAGVAPEWGISLQTLSRARLNFSNVFTSITEGTFTFSASAFQEVQA